MEHDMQVRFFVPGVPQPGGSKKGWVNKFTGRVNVSDANPKAKEWKAVVAQVASEHFTEPISGPLRVKFEFFFLRPQGHYGSGKNQHILKPSAPLYPVVRPDALKCARSTEDAMTKIAWLDDSQIVTEELTKRYGAQSGALITIESEIEHVEGSENTGLHPVPVPRQG